MFGGWPEVEGEGSTLVRHTEEGLGALNDPRRSPCSRNRTDELGGRFKVEEKGTGRWSWGLYSVRVGGWVGNGTAPVVTKLSWCREGKVRSRHMGVCASVSGGGRRGVFRQRAPRYDDDDAAPQARGAGESTAASRARLRVLEIFRRARPQSQHTAARRVTKRRLFVRTRSLRG